MKLQVIYRVVSDIIIVGRTQNIYEKLGKLQPSTPYFSQAYSLYLISSSTLQKLIRNQLSHALFMLLPWHCPIAHFVPQHPTTLLSSSRVLHLVSYSLLPPLWIASTHALRWLTFFNPSQYYFAMLFVMRMQTLLPHLCVPTALSHTYQPQSKHNSLANATPQYVSMGMLKRWHTRHTCSYIQLPTPCTPCLDGLANEFIVISLQTSKDDESY